MKGWLSDRAAPLLCRLKRKFLAVHIIVFVDRGLQRGEGNTHPLPPSGLSGETLSPFDLSGEALTARGLSVEASIFNPPWPLRGGNPFGPLRGGINPSRPLRGDINPSGPPHVHLSTLQDVGVTSTRFTQKSS